MPEQLDRAIGSFSKSAACMPFELNTESVASRLTLGDELVQASVSTTMICLERALKSDLESSFLAAKFRIHDRPVVCYSKSLSKIPFNETPF